MINCTVYLFSACLLLSTVYSQKDNGENCDCFRTSGFTESYFLNHRFFDFRNIVARYKSEPEIVSVLTDPKNKSPSSDFFSSSSWTRDWDIQTWNNAESLNDSSSDAKTLMSYSMNNVYIEDSNDNGANQSTHLTLRTTKTETFQSAAEIDSVAVNFQYISARFYARVQGSPGACAGMFTWYCPGLCRSASSEHVEEADIEILTSDPQNKVHFTNQPSESPLGFTYRNATSNATMPNSNWTQWNEYRYDWVPGLSAWYLNGDSIANISFHAPEEPAQLIMNMWSNGGSWTGNMSISETAYLQIQWIQIAFNTSAPKRLNKAKRQNQARCRTVCSIDDTVTKGFPVAMKGDASQDLRVPWWFVCGSLAMIYLM